MVDRFEDKPYYTIDTGTGNVVKRTRTHLTPKAKQVLGKDFYEQRSLMPHGDHPNHYRVFDIEMENDAGDFRSLAQAVKHVLEVGGGQIQFPDEQTVLVDPRRRGQILVQHSSHGWDVEYDERIFERDAIQRVARVVRRFSPQSTIKFRGEEDDYELLD